MRDAVLAVCDITRNVRSPQDCGYVAADDPRFRLGLIDRFVYSGGPMGDFFVAFARGLGLILALLVVTLLVSVAMAASSEQRREALPEEYSRSGRRPVGEDVRRMIVPVTAGALVYFALITVALVAVLLLVPLLRWAI